MGSETTASGYYSTAMGSETTARGNLSTTMGFRTIAEDYFSFAIGSHNKTDETPNPNAFSFENIAFVIGNGGFDSDGSYDGHLSNAIEILFDGTTTIAGDLNINSDARLKANIISLGATLSKLLQIDGKTYTMKKDTNHKKKIGLLAQDIEKVFPELVTETNDIKSVNYQGLVPVLINAMKEQQDEIERLKKQEAKLNKQQQEIDELKAIKIGPFTIEQILGGEIKEKVEISEFQRDRLIKKLLNFAQDYFAYLLKEVLSKITDAIKLIPGLDAIIAFLTFDFCKFLEIIGVPKTIQLPAGIQEVADAIENPLPNAITVEEAG